MKKLLAIILMAILCVTAVSAATFTVSKTKLVPKFSPYKKLNIVSPLFVLDDFASVSDVILMHDLMAKLQAETGTMIPVSWSALNSQVTITSCKHRVTTFIYEGEILIIVPDQASAGQVNYAMTVAQVYQGLTGNPVHPSDVKLHSQLQYDDLRLEI
ncbi:hypothetical protein ACFL0V_02660 [Nanoarchaeota archaeon]